MGAVLSVLVEHHISTMALDAGLGGAVSIPSRTSVRGSVAAILRAVGRYASEELLLRVATGKCRN